MEEPGIDEYDWETEWEQLEPDVQELPAESLSELDDLVARMMEARGLELQEREGEDLSEPETVREFEEARRVTRLVDSGESVDPGDIAAAVNGYRNLYELLRDAGPTRESPA
ncbi:MAG TPA: hypothetical protein VHC45_00640 [Gaiellaceae bacterium]|jgi:hypothetical protein|nr:hypothetical protein [Gaiellaceae bacterium]